MWEIVSNFVALENLNFKKIPLIARLSLEPIVGAIRGPPVQVYLFQKLATSGEHVVYKDCSECQNKNKKQFMYTSCSPDVLSLQFS
jgi:hypothetical protein